MSQVMSTVGDSDALAAEYVLGTLDAEERAQARTLLTADEAFATKVKLWERRLGELHLMVEPVEPDGRIWERIRVKVPAQPPGPEPAAEATPPPSAQPAPTAQSPAQQEAVAQEPTPQTPLKPGSLPVSQTAAPTPVAMAAPVDAAAERVADPAAAEATTAHPPPVPSVFSARPGAPAAPVLAPAAALASAVAVEERVAAIARRLTRWRVFGLLMMLMVLAVAALLAAWRFAPERVPPELQPVALMRLVGVTIAQSPPSRPAPPPESQYDE